MDIQKNESCKRLITVLICLFSSLMLGSDYNSLNILKGSYQISGKDQIPNEIEKLINAHKNSDNKLLKQRINYRIAMLYFKSQNLKQAYELFEQISSDIQYPKQIQLLAINMAAQTAKMQGRDAPAIKHYDQLINMIHMMIRDSSNKTSIRTLEEMYCASVISKTEIYTFQKQYSQAIKQYQNALGQIKNETFKSSQNYLPLFYDRLSQLYLKIDDVKQYQHCASIITDEFSDYKRTGIIKLESFVIEFFNKQNIKQQYPNGSFDAPAKLILYIKNNPDCPDIEHIVSLFDQLCKLPESKGLWQIRYHYAWLLDATGKKEAALKTFNTIIDSIDLVDETDNYIKEKILNYSKLQIALIHCEHEQYLQGLKYLDSIENKNNDDHISSLTDSIRNSIQTLKREVAQDENK